MMNEEVEKELREQAQAIDKLTAQNKKEKLRMLACRLKMLDAQAFTYLNFKE